MARQAPKRRGPTKKVLDDANQVMQLRTLGVTFRAIASQLGISVSRAHQLQEIALKATLKETTAEYVTLQEERVELLLRKALTGEANAETGKDKAALINTALRATDQLNRMRGIYDMTETEAQAQASTLLDMLIENSRKAAATTTSPTDTETQ